MNMRVIKLKSSFVSGLFSLLLFFPGCAAAKYTSLSDVTKPWLGEYECRLATDGNVDYLKDYQYIRLHLISEEDYLLTCKTKLGDCKSTQGKYRYDKERGVIILELDVAGGIKREFPLQKGVISITIPFGAKTFRAEFEQ